VVVVSAQSRRADVFKALELGALDFVAKPDDAGLDAVREELLEKCATVRALRIENLHGVEAPGRGGPERPGDAPRVALVGASTGGPQALLQLLAALPGDLPLGVLVAQHMPAQFTAAFAQRLGRAARFAVQEAGDGDLIAAGRVLVAPGGRHLEVRRDEDGLLRAAVLPRDAAGPPSRYCPSVDRLFRSGAAALGPRAAAVVLTGMGQDGSEGIVAVKRAGGLTLVEAAETAVVDGMPAAAGRTGAVDEELSLPALADRLVRFARAGGRG
jgi:two-component system chemotaxis response regulator CheB